MKYLIVFVLFFTSCSHNKYLRAPSSLITNETQLFDSFKRLSFDYLMGDNPQGQSHYREKKSQIRDFYELLGQVDRGLHQKVRPKYFGFGVYSGIFNSEGVKQISFEKWESLRPIVLKSFRAGRHVFLHEGELLTVWGVKLSEENINDYILTSIKRSFPQVAMNSILLSLFNHEEFVQLDSGYFALPSLKRLSRDFVERLPRVFAERVGIGEYSFASIYNYDVTKAPINIAGYQNYFLAKYQAYFNGEGFESPQGRCELKIRHLQLNRHRVMGRFIKTLEEEKATLMKDLKLTNNEYDDLAAVAIGVIDVESKNGTSAKLHFKESKLGRMLVYYYKRYVRKDPIGSYRLKHDSRGLPQIKDVESHLESTSYSDIGSESLLRPREAAIASMALLASKNRSLKNLKHLHPHINSFNWSDYLYYFYQGKRRQITRGVATPRLNLRIRKIMSVRKKLLFLRKCESL